MKKIAKILGITALSIGVLAACAETDVETGGSNDAEGKKTEQKKEAKKDDGSKKFNAGINHEVSGLKINIAEVKITDKQIQIGMNLENTTDQKLTFYPDQGNAIVGDMQLAAGLFGGSGTVSGDINGGIKMDGVVVYDAPEGKTIDVKKVTEIKLDMGDVFNDETMNAENATITIPVK
ncbi:hypothetical protein EI200_04520 [Peribacillus simplex]|uniref:hypothetical protein n=1 Tax=Peribacillus simplex TaxID=1478 RepID=UPI000F6368F1|nr:hypothetical protein [Peribacillus simplex]RRN73949.1 hypothetical protein EI200_04520 [Peribacillus simplex]